MNDLRVGLRNLLARPGFSAVAVLALALGIGANTAIFSVVDGVLLRPLPYPDSGRLVAVYDLELESGEQHAAAGPDVLAWRMGVRSFSGVGAYRGTSLSLTGDEGALRVDGAIVDRSFFGVVGIRPSMGRAISPSAGAGPEAVLSERLWKSRFHGDPAIVGKAITVNGDSYVVNGVVADGEGFPETRELWLSPRWLVPEHPLQPTQDPLLRMGSHYLDVVARLAPGVTVAQAQAELATVAKRLGDAKAVDQDGARLVPLREDLVGQTRPQLLMLFAAVGLILLIACSNVAHLLLARALARRHEVAIRLALGATRGRLIRLFLAESGILAFAGALVGLVGAMWAIGPLAQLAPRALGPSPVAIDGPVLLFTAAVAILTAVAFGVLPALTVGPPAEHLRESSRTTTGTGSRVRLRSILVGLEVALSLVLLVGAGLLVRSLLALQDVDPGFGGRTSLTAELSLPTTRYADPGKRERFYTAVLERLLAAPGVEAAGAVTRLPFGSGASSRTMAIDGRSEAEGIDADLKIVSPGYLDALRLPLRAGRDFTNGDTSNAPRTVLVNETFARRAWPGQSALGKRVTASLDDVPGEVVGVVADTHQGALDLATRPEVYVPIAIDPWPLMTFVVRGRGSPAVLGAEVTRAVAAVDSLVATNKVMTMDERIDASLKGRRFAALLLGGLAGLALVLALVGIYGVIAYTVTQRTRELGIRLALGARPASLLGLVVSQSMRPVVVGVAAGLILALVTGRAIESLLYAVSATDPTLFVAVPLLLLGASALAAVLAARRATQVDPMLALRAD